MKNNQLSIS